MNTAAVKGNVSISKEVLAELPAEAFSGNIHVIDTRENLIKALKNLGKSQIIGFDTETRPTFQKGHHFNVSLIQLSTLTDAYLIRINKTGIPNELIEFLQNPQILKIGLSIKDDFHNLRKLMEVEPVNFIELQNYVKNFLISDNSLTKIYAVLFDKRISKSQRLTNWEAEHLTLPQQMYAALDAAACLKIYNYLKDGNFEPLKSKYYKEFDEMIPEIENNEIS